MSGLGTFRGYLVRHLGRLEFECGGGGGRASKRFRGWCQSGATRSWCDHGHPQERSVDERCCDHQYRPAAEQVPGAFDLRCIRAASVGQAWVNVMCTLQNVMCSLLSALRRSSRSLSVGLAGSDPMHRFHSPGLADTVDQRHLAAGPRSRPLQVGSVVDRDRKA